MMRVTRGILGVCFLVFASTVGGPTAAQNLPRYEIAYATYLGGSNWDQAREVIPFPDGSVLVGAQTSSVDMPTTTGAVQPQYAGDDPNLGHGGVFGGDCYLARLNSDGSQIVSATYFGGSKQERNVYGMELDRNGNVVITSMTRSQDLPTTEGCFQPKHGGGRGSVFAAKISADLRQLVWCTYLGGSGDEAPRGGLALDAMDHVCIFGTTASGDFPTTPGAFQRKRNGARDAFVTKLKADGSGLVWSTLFGGRAEDYMLGGRLDGKGDVYFAGHTTSDDLPRSNSGAQPIYGGQHDGYVVKLAGEGSRPIYVSYVGGRANEFPEHRPFITEDGALLLPGVTGSPDFPTTTGALQRKLNGKNDAFLTKVSPDGRQFQFSTLFGGSATEFCLMPTPTRNGQIIVVGQTESRDLPVTSGAIQATHGGGKSDGWLAVFAPDAARLVYCTYLGGSGDDMVRSVALGSKGELYLVGHTASRDFPNSRGAAQTQYGGGSGDAFVMKLIPSGV
jgi:hypothetical protein